jgi:hypothetical protein
MNPLDFLKQSAKPGRTRRTARPCVEALEDRCVPAVVLGDFGGHGFLELATRGPVAGAAFTAPAPKGLAEIDPQPEPPRAKGLPPLPYPGLTAKVPGWVKADPQPEPPAKPGTPTNAVSILFPVFVRGDGLERLPAVQKTTALSGIRSVIVAPAPAPGMAFAAVYVMSPWSNQ